jgi:hypothetical protein
MPSRKIPILLAAVAVFALAANATDFWLTKDWKQWSKGDCENLFAESPWAHTWRSGDQLAFAVQLRSSLPIRQAIVRQLQFDQKYDKMTDAQRGTFDAQAAQILNRTYDDAILVHVDFSRSSVADRLGADLHAYVQKGIEQLNALLITDDETKLAPSRFDMSPKTPGTFDLVFPRLVNGVPAIKDGQKHFSVQFQTPQLIQPDIPSRHVRVDFDLSKMAVSGKLSY